MTAAYTATFSLLLISNSTLKQGRQADGGHYMGWVRQKEDDWLVFDDDEVLSCKAKDIARLKGGGDWHQAYLVFYAWSPK